MRTIQDHVEESSVFFKDSDAGFSGSIFQFQLQPEIRKEPAVAVADLDDLVAGTGHLSSVKDSSHPEGFAKLNRFFLLIKNNTKILTNLFHISEDEILSFCEEFTLVLSSCKDAPTHDRDICLANAENRLQTFLVRRLTTAKEYQVFEEHILGLRNTDETHLREYLYPPDLVNALRAHGKRLFGIDKIESRIENRFGLEIETENFWPFSGFNLIWRGRMDVLKSSLELLEKSLDFLPLELRKVARVKKIFLTTEVIADKKTLGTDSPKILGGQAIPGYFVYSGSPNTFFHEFFHCLDFSDGMLTNDLDYALDAYGFRGSLRLYAEFAKQKTNRLLRRPEKSEVLDSNRISSGFSSLYGAKNFFSLGNFAEDQADLAADIINGPLFPLLYRRILPKEWAEKYPQDQPLTADPILDAKVIWMMEFLHKKSGGLMDDGFWLDFVKAGDFKKFDESYWQKKRITLQTGL